MRMLVAAAVILSVSGLQAQSQRQGRNERFDKIYEQQQKQQKEDEKDYNDTMRRLKTNDKGKIQNDPWRTVRPLENTGRR